MSSGTGRYITEQLTELRISKGITQAALAEKIGITQSGLARLESGKHSPQIATVIKVANALGYTLQLEMDWLSEEAGPIESDLL